MRIAFVYYRHEEPSPRREFAIRIPIPSLYPLRASCALKPRKQPVEEVALPPFVSSAPRQCIVSLFESETICAAISRRAVSSLSLLLARPLASVGGQQKIFVFHESSVTDPLSLLRDIHICHAIHCFCYRFAELACDRIVRP